MKTIRNNIFTGLGVLTLFTACLKTDVNYALGEANPEVSLSTIRTIFKSTAVDLTADVLGGAVYSKALVVSDLQGKNLPAGYVAVQNSWRNQTRGILVKLQNQVEPQFGDSIQIDLRQAKLIPVNGMLVLENAPITTLNTGNTVRSRAVAIATLAQKFEEYESTYIDLTADLETEPVAGTPLIGSQILVDNEANKVDLFTADQAHFAQESVAPSATFRGLAFRDGQTIQLRLQQYSGMDYPSGKIYGGWPETFEDPYQAKASYAARILTFPTGDWNLDQSLQGNTAGRDRIVSGKQAIRFQQNLTTPALLQMNFDVPNGASKVTFWYGAYYTDRASSFRLEYSQDQGQTWMQVGQVITDAHSTAESLQAKQAVFMMNIQGPVRFRIYKLGLGTSNNTVNNGRLGVDDFSIFKSY